MAKIEIKKETTITEKDCKRTENSTYIISKDSDSWRWDGIILNKEEVKELRDKLNKLCGL